MTREDGRWGEGVSVGETGQDLNVGTGLMSAARLASAFLWEKTSNFGEKGSEEETLGGGQEL